MASRRPLRILTYNVWFSTKYMKERMRGIGDIIEAHEPDLVALQEVTSEVLLHLSNQRWYKEYHKTVPNNRERYFVMIFSKTPLLEYEKVSFPNSHMGRELVVTRIASTEDQTNTKATLCFSTTHLESLEEFTYAREEQLRLSLDFLGSNDDVVMCGDMNLMDHIDGEILLPEGWDDSWLVAAERDTGNGDATSCSKSEGSDCEKDGPCNGYTRDPLRNLMIQRQGVKRNRLDRVLCKLRNYSVSKAQLMGTQEIAPGVFPSDHFGLMVDLLPRSEPGPETSKSPGKVVFKRPGQKHNPF